MISVIKNFIIGGLIVSGVNLIAEKYNEKYACLLSAFPIGILAALFLVIIIKQKYILMGML